MDVPVKLGAVPGVGQWELVIKATTSGITLLKQNSFRRRYTGNKHSAVDINGNLWLSAADLKKSIQPTDTKHKKTRPPVETGGLKSFTDPGQIYDKLSDTQQLPQKKERMYTINKREVRQRLLGFLNTQNGKKCLYFWTVTFPKGTPDKVAYRMFNIWLTTLRQYKMLRNYIWVAERQTLTGHNTVHFHIAIPHRMSVGRANCAMRTTLKTFAKRGEIPGYTALRARNYNGVDIAKNRNTGRVTNFALKKGARSLTTYLTKYVTKNDGSFSHLAWHNSRGYSSIFTGVTFSVPEFINYGFNLLIDRRKRLDGEFFTFLPWIEEPPDIVSEHLYKLNSFIQSLIN